MALALSTSWNSFQHSQAKDLISEIRDLGFKEIELNFKLTSEMVSQIKPLVKSGVIKVASLHNFCPIPENLTPDQALPDYYSIASLNEEERQRAVKETKRSIDTAVELEAKAVVLHSGRVQITDYTIELIRLYNQGLKATEDYRLLFEKMLKERLDSEKTHFAKTLKSLEELNRYAQKRAICLGVENRFYHREIPSFAEIGKILDEFKDANIFYWHDTGHAQVLENLGIGKHEDYLKRYGARMIGMHLHDVVGTKDHQAPHSGEFDFKLLLPFMRKEIIKVIEAHQPASGKDLVESKKYLESIFNGKL